MQPKIDFNFKSRIVRSLKNVLCLNLLKNIFSTNIICVLTP